MSQESPIPPKAPANPTPPNSPPQPTRVQALLRMAGQLGGIIWSFVPVVLNLLRQFLQFVLGLLKWLWQEWSRLLPKLRTALPEPWKTKLPDFVFTAIASLLLIGLLWLPTAILSPGSSPAIAELPADRSIAPAAPEPEVDLAQIAAIQAQLAAVTTEYSEDLIQAVKANFLRSKLTASVSDSWYSLDPAQHDRLANELLSRSQKLDFSILEIVDREGHLLARSPVVGKKMVMFDQQGNG